MTDEPNGRPDWATVPNIITAARLVLFMPVVVGLIASRQHAVATTILLVAWASTDWVDGFLARRLHQQTRLGEIIDPLADRAGELTIYATLLAVGLMPWWAVVVVVGVDLFMFAVVAARLRGLRPVAVTWIGKVRTFLLMGALPLLTVSQADGVPTAALLSAATALLALGCVLHVVAGVTYAVGLSRHR